MGNDFEKMSLRELFTNIQAFLILSLGVIFTLLAMLLLMLWGYAG